ncbi:MAG: peptidyl-prolyl cis-trans isomerase [Myxococcales bacterium]|nr:peptidyl-prolyl cis-trans isomerase [Myxococcales bacterium]
MPRTVRSLVGLLFVVALLSACSGKKDASDDASKAKDEKSRYGLTPEQASEVLVKIGSTQITVGEFADELAAQSPYLRARYNSPERRKEYLDSLVRFELLAQEAKRRGYYEQEDVANAKKQAMVQQMMRSDFDEKFKLADVSDADIKAYYEAHISEFKKPEQLRLARILISNKAAAQRALGQLLAAPKDDAQFKRLAEQTTEDTESKAGFGDVGFFSRPEEMTEEEKALEAAKAHPLPLAAVAAAFKLKDLGEVVPELVEGPGGYNIIRLLARRPPLVRTLDEARRNIQDLLRRERRDAAVDKLVSELRSKAQVKEDLGLLSQVKVDAPTGMPTSPGTAPVPGHP